VLENSDKNAQVINAMVMNAPGPPQKIVTPRPAPAPPKPVVVHEKMIPKPIEQKVIQPAPKKDAIAILDRKQKKLAEDKLQQQLLNDLQTQTDHEKKVKQKQKAVANAFAKEMRELSAKSLQQQMQQETQRLAGAQTQAMRGVVDKYKALILQAISHNWLVPPSVNKKLSAELLIRLAPGGMVLDVQVAKSSGDEGLDHSAQAAVFKASPLPVPHDSDEFESFRQFVLKVKPENILGSDA
jgi:colicin import membrane protein